MGWLWGASKADPDPNSSTSPSTSPSNSDPFRDLDPSLRDFLATEPTHNPPNPPLPPSSPPTNTTTTTAPDAPLSSPPALPDAPPMIYPDGRYADLWSSYRPLAIVESEVQTDQEKLLDVLDGYKTRKERIAQAALENCALEQGEVNDCFRKGSWARRVTMCSEENRGFERCYLMQSKFLKALGYLSSSGRANSIDEEIQMHADTLYHRMLAQEAAIATAKANNAPIPQFPPPTITSPTSVSTTSPPVPTTPFPHPLPLPAKSPEEFSKDHLLPAAREALQDRLKDLSPQERALEERATAMEASQTDAVGRTVTSILDEGERKRRERREKGESRWGDVVSGWFGR